MIENDPSKQQSLPGIRPYFTRYFEEGCGTAGGEGFGSAGRLDFLGCQRPSGLLAIYFRMGHYNHDDVEELERPELLGFDCPFPDSQQVFACTPAHLDGLLRHMQENWYAVQSCPDIIVNANGGIEKEAYFQLMRNLGKAVGEAYFSGAGGWSHGHECLEDLWKREKHHFGFG